MCVNWAPECLDIKTECRKYVSGKKKSILKKEKLTAYLICNSISVYYKFTYYIDMSILPKNRQVIRKYIQDTSEVFSISSLLKISPTSFLCFSFFF